MNETHHHPAFHSAAEEELERIALDKYGSEMRKSYTASELWAASMRKISVNPFSDERNNEPRNTALY